MDYSIGKCCVIFPLLFAWYCLKLCFLPVKLLFNFLEFILKPKPKKERKKAEQIRYEEPEDEEDEDQEDTKDEIKRQKLIFQIQTAREDLQHLDILLDGYYQQYNRLQDKGSKKALTLANQIHNTKKKFNKALYQIKVAQIELKNMTPDQ